MSKLAKFATAAALLLALASCQGAAVEQASPSDGAVPADGSEYPAPSVIPLEEPAQQSAYPSPS